MDMKLGIVAGNVGSGTTEALAVRPGRQTQLVAEIGLQLPSNDAHIPSAAGGNGSEFVHTTLLSLDFGMF